MHNSQNQRFIFGAFSNVMAIGIAVKALYLQRHDVFVFDKIHTYVTKNKVSIFYPLENFLQISITL